MLINNDQKNVYSILSKKIYYFFILKTVLNFVFKVFVMEWSI